SPSPSPVMSPSPSPVSVPVSDDIGSRASSLQPEIVTREASNAAGNVRETLGDVIARHGTQASRARRSALGHDCSEFRPGHLSARAGKRAPRNERGLAPRVRLDSCLSFHDGARLGGSLPHDPPTELDRSEEPPLRSAHPRDRELGIRADLQYAAGG